MPSQIITITNPTWQQSSPSVLSDWHFRWYKLRDGNAPQLICWFRFYINGLVIYFLTHSLTSLRIGSFWLGGMSPKWPIFCRVGRKTSTQTQEWQQENLAVENPCHEHLVLKPVHCTSYLTSFSSKHVEDEDQQGNRVIQLHSNDHTHHNYSDMNLKHTCMRCKPWLASWLLDSPPVQIFAGCHPTKHWRAIKSVANNTMGWAFIDPPTRQWVDVTRPLF